MIADIYASKADRKNAFMEEKDPFMARIERWAYSTELDEAFDDDFAEYEDHAESIAARCGLENLYRFAADPSCLKRDFFAEHLAWDLCWIYRIGVILPFHFSRFLGLGGQEAYLAEVAANALKIYEKCQIIERMRCANDPVLNAMAKVLLDYRHDHTELTYRSYIELVRRLHRDVVPLFEHEDS